MKTMQTKVANRSLLTGCWIYEDRRYICADTESLPCEMVSDECVLKDNGIPYRISERNGQNVCEYWNPEYYEEKEVTLPLYAKVFDRYQYVGRTYTGTTLTAETLKKAWDCKFGDFVEGKIREYHRYLREIEIYRKAKEVLDGGIAKTYHEATLKNKSIFDIKANGDHFRCLAIFDARGNFLHQIAIFDMKKVVLGGYVTLQVPKHLEGWVKGAQGSVIRSWAAAIGVKRINVVPY